MKVWVLMVQPCDDNTWVEIFGTCQAAYDKWNKLRESDLECFDEDPTEDEDLWEQWEHNKPESWGYKYDSGDNGWTYVTVRAMEVQGLTGRNAI